MDHKAAAEEITGIYAEDWHKGEVAVAHQTEALVHATLYLAEQQRIANLIAYVGSRVSNGFGAISGVLEEIDTALWGGES